MRCFVLLVFLVLPVAAFAADAAPAQSAASTSPQKTSCGTTPDDALREARHALAKTDAGSERTAVACLIEAVTELKSQNLVVVRSDGDRVIAVPFLNTTNGRQ
jgi:hypothetical protein